jgi:hypothetical protein
VFNNKKDKYIKTNKELLNQVLSSKDEFESLYNILQLQFQSLLGSPYIEVVFHDDKVFKKVSDLIAKKVN